ncbi:MAG: hypothetical protein CM15mP92_1680 [Halieaceae bacterium]|nr:MAG: hypothetical protein CM15mP92_1680 [Halieaceae bacterium]
MDVLGVPHNMTKQLRRMSRHGVLGRYLPAFGKSSADAVRFIPRLYRGCAHDRGDRQYSPLHAPLTTPTGSRIDPDCPPSKGPRLLYIAALFHDIGKAGRRSLGARASMPRTFDRSRFIATDTELIVWLVKNHS